MHVVAGTNVNWALSNDGSGITVINAGYPADTADVLGSIRQIGGRLAEVRAVLITHAHRWVAHTPRAVHGRIGTAILWFQDTDCPAVSTDHPSPQPWGRDHHSPTLTTNR